ncbi:TPA: formate C-acetyltransferase [Klebsiella michiganensis]
MTNRTQRLKDRLFANPREISLERALLYTASHKQTEGEPVMIRRAKATAWVLDHVQISIRDDELIAGNRTIKPRAGIMSPEMDPYWLLKELDQFPTRPQDRFNISEEDKRIYREVLFPYWENRSMKDFINAQMTDEVKAAVSTQIFSVNQTDKGQGHIIIDYPRLLENGLAALVAEMKAVSQRHPQNNFYQAVLILLEASQRHILRYAALADDMAAGCGDGQRRKELETIADISRHNAVHRPEDFWQACQLFWYMNIILQYESNASSISLGRFDQYMLPYYQASLNRGQDPQFLQELLESLWVKCNDIVLLRSTSSARYFAGFPTGYTALLGGLTETGRSAVNILSFLSLDAYQNVRLPQPNLGVRINELVDRPFLRKTAETIRLGTGIPQIFNDEVVIPAFLNRGVSLDDARDYSVVGCVELSIPGRTYGLHDIAMFNLLKVMEIVMLENESNPDITWDGLINQIRDKIRYYIKLMVEGSNICDIGHRDWAPVPLLSSFIEDCVQHGQDITEGGARYNFSGVQGIGIANLSDSLHALKGMVFEQKRLSFAELIAVLKANFQTPEGEQLADGGLSPMLGQDVQGPTAVLKSVSKLDNFLLSNGTLLNVKFTPATLAGDGGLNKLADFLQAFTRLKLQHIQFNVVNADTLREAQQRPQDFAGLVVRVAGYSAFFVELSQEIQDDIIRRTAHQL